MAPIGEEMRSETICAVVSTADRRFGFAVFSEEKRALWICEYHEDTHISRTEALLLQVQPRSCCVVSSESDHSKTIARVAESCGVTLSQLKAPELKMADLEQDLLRLLRDTTGCGLGRHMEEQRQKQGMRALCALIAHGALLSEPANFGACTLGLYPLKSFMYLDKAAFSALNVLPRPEDSLRAATSIFGFLNRCRSPLGTRRLRQWVSQPLSDATEISHRHDLVEIFSTAEELLRQVEAHFRQVPDLERISSRLHRIGTKSQAQKANLEDIVSLYQCVRGALGIAQALETYTGAHKEVLSSTVIAPLRACVKDAQNFCALVEQTIDLRQAEQRNYCINSAFDPSLQQLAGVRDQVRDQMEAVRKAVDNELGLSGRAAEKPVSLVDCPEGKALRVTKKHQQQVQNSKSRTKFKPLSIKKMEFLFTTVDLERLNGHFNDAVKKYDDQSQQLVSKALAVAATYRPVVDRLAECLGSLDVLAAFARAALAAPCTFVRPQLDPEGNSFDIQGATHVLVVANSEKSFISNDLQMDRETSRLHLITGPNMGGKSTYIRSVALVAFMNQIGSFVPCTRAVLPVFDAIMCRVGASDMQLRGISTFMAEMLEASCILNTATSRTLVVVDELGRGTSTADGFGIAWAIAKHLVEETRCYTLFATHFHELAALATAIPCVRNRRATAAVDAASGRLTFLYALADGAADESYGTHCAALAGFPAHVVEAARIRAKEFEAESGYGDGRTPKRAKRSTTAAAETEAAEALAYVLAAADEVEFARRALEKSALLQALTPAAI